ncbi:MAG: hypothetical protein ACQGVK_24925 [Myxococcota bacterium]
MPEGKALVHAAWIGAIAAVIAAVVGGLFTLNGGANLEPTPEPPDLEPNRQSFDPVPLETLFVPSGWMGDGEEGAEHLEVNDAAVTLEGVPGVATRIAYRPGLKGWAGVYWQHPDGNWGQRPGKDLTGASSISFLARGERGGEIVEFKSGGIKGEYPDTHEVSTGKIALSQDWRHIEIDVSHRDLSNVVGALAWIAAAPRDGEPIIVYLARLTIK